MNLPRLLGSKPTSRLEPLDDGAIIHIARNGRTIDSVRLGKNHVHAFIVHADGDLTDLGISENLLTNVGRTLAHEALGQRPAKEGALTASSATSATPSGGGMAVDAYKGWRIWCPVTGLTTPPVYGNIGSNSATVVTIDQWWNAADGTGTTPASTNGYMIMPSALPRFMALTENASAASASSTTLTGEITTGGANRQLATFAHTGGTATSTLQKAYSITASFPAIHRMGLFTAANVTAAGILVFETVLNADANVVNGDTLTVTDTITISG